jgi:hypothetical protein
MHRLHRKFFVTPVAICIPVQRLMRPTYIGIVFMNSNETPSEMKHVQEKRRRRAATGCSTVHTPIILISIVVVHTVGT